MGAPNTTVDIPAMWELAEKTKMPISGKDFKTGQTLVKSGFAPILKVRNLGLSGWFSTNILGNRDGLVLDEPANFHTKEVSKLSTWRPFCARKTSPTFTATSTTRCASTTIRRATTTRRDGTHRHLWLDGLPHADQDQLPLPRLDTRRTVAARPHLLSDLAARAGRYGIQRFLSFFLKSPMHDYTQGEEAVNNLYDQYVLLKNAIREMGGYEADQEID
jgi:myo-inositol-1-phosphate synthase